MFAKMSDGQTRCQTSRLSPLVISEQQSTGGARKQNPQHTGPVTIQPAAVACLQWPQRKGRGGGGEGGGGGGGGPACRRASLPPLSCSSSWKPLLPQYNPRNPEPLKLFVFPKRGSSDLERGTISESRGEGPYSFSPPPEGALGVSHQLT